MEIEQKIEAILFYKGSPVKFSELTRLTKESEQKVKQAVKSLRQSLSGRGISIIVHDKEVVLVTAPDADGLIAQLVGEEHNRDLSRAALEVLTIILYKSPVARGTIDYIRGVNSQNALRSLLERGLIEREEKRAEERGVFYMPSMLFLEHMGVGSVSELPDYDQIREKMK